jgi:hypothetical protein
MHSSICWLLASYFKLVSCLAYPTIQIMEAVYVFETSIDFGRMGITKAIFVYTWFFSKRKKICWIPPDYTELYPGSYFFFQIFFYFLFYFLDWCVCAFGNIIVWSFLRNCLEGCNSRIVLDTEFIFCFSTAFARDICPSGKHLARYPQSKDAVKHVRFK